VHPTLDRSRVPSLCVSSGCEELDDVADAALTDGAREPPQLGGAVQTRHHLRGNS